MYDCCKKKEKRKKTEKTQKEEKRTLESKINKERIDNNEAGVRNSEEKEREGGENGLVKGKEIRREMRAIVRAVSESRFSTRQR